MFFKNDESHLLDLSTPELKVAHPFYPVGVEIVNFIANDKTVLQLLASFATGCAVILSATWLLTSAVAPRLRTMDKIIVLWFCLCKKTSRTWHGRGH